MDPGGLVRALPRIALPLEASHTFNQTVQIFVQQKGLKKTTATNLQQLVQLFSSDGLPNFSGPSCGVRNNSLIANRINALGDSSQSSRHASSLVRMVSRASDKCCLAIPKRSIDMANSFDTQTKSPAVTGPKHRGMGAQPGQSRRA